LTPPMQFYEPIIAIGGAAFMIWFEIQVGHFIIKNKDRWIKSFRSSRLHAWLDEHEPGIRINCRDGSSLAVGWFR